MTRRPLQPVIRTRFRVPAFRREGLPPRLWLVLARARPARLRVVSRTLSTTIAPRFSLVLAPRFEAGDVYVGGPSLEPAVVRDPCIVRRDVERLVERLATKVTRVEPAAVGAGRRGAEPGLRPPPLPPLPGAAPTAGRPAPVLAQVAAAPAGAPLFPRLAHLAPTTSPPAVERLPQPHAPVEAASVTPATAPPLDVAQLTEQVLERLDHRVVAERERRGRI
ncbi:MAG TPA: hypothetical protein VF327_00045 [Gaiellaceae bacterium]